MSDTITVAGVTLASSGDGSWDRVAVRPVLMAYDGQVGVGSIAIRDSGVLETVSGRRVQVKHGTDLVADGFLGQQVRSRPADDALLRYNAYSLQDNNLLLAHRRIASWSRPAETDRARVLAAMAAFCSAVSTVDFVPNTNTVSLPAKAYKDTSLDEVFADALDMSAKTYFVDNERRLHYHLLEEDAGFNATIAISDQAPDGLTTFAPGDPVRMSEPYNLVNDLNVRGSGGNLVNVADAGSVAAHDADGLRHQDTVQYPDSNSAGDLTAYGNAQLAGRKDDRTSWRCSLSHIADPALLEAGMRIEITSAVMGLAGEWRRIATLSWETPAPGVWVANLEIGSPPRAPLELRHRRRAKKALTADDIADAEIGSVDTLSAPTQKQADTGSVFGTGPFSYGTRLFYVVMSTISDNTIYPYCGCPLGCGGWGPGVAEAEAWYEYALPDPIDASWIGIEWTVPAAVPIHGAAAAQIMGVAFGAPSAFGDFVPLATLPLDADGTVFVPRSMLRPGVTNYLVRAPAWHAVGAFYCEQDLGGGAGSGCHGPYWTGDGNSGQAQVYDISGHAIGLVTSGRTPWLSGIGAVDGANSTFELIGWDGSGVPEARIGAVILSADDYTYDGTAKTVTFSESPAAESDVRFRYRAVV